MSTLSVTHNRYICTATIERPEAHNALNFALIDELEALINTLQANESRVFILTGAGNESFMAGGDLKEFHGLEKRDDVRQMARRVRSLLDRIEALPCWTIACLNGSAYGGGIELMLAFDMAFATANAAFGFTQGRFYLPPGWGGITRLVERVGRPKAMEWLGQAAVIAAEEAHSNGLVNAVFASNELRHETNQRAERLSRNGRAFIQALKKGGRTHAEARRKAIKNELAPFVEFWVDERHQQRVQEFLDST